jgi:DNA repair protein RadC
MEATTKLFELKKIQTNFPKVKISSSEQSEKFIRNFYGDDLEIFESFFLLLLDRNNQTIGFSKISQGGISGTVVDIRIIAKYAVESLCSGVILAHNHPSGNLNPSLADEQITIKTKDALKLFDIVVLDHIILTADSYFSFSDNGKI